MRCCYCGVPVAGVRDITIVRGEGPAHSACHHRVLASRRIFQHIELSRLSDEELLELREMVLTEANSRQAGSEGASLELF